MEDLAISRKKINELDQQLAKVAELANDSAILPYLQKIYQEIMHCSREYQKSQRKD